MSNETKQDVFDAVWNRLAGYQVFFNGWPRETLDGYKKRYDNALPDDLPVIPEAVGKYIKRQKDDLLTEQLFVIFLTIQHNINTDNPPDLKAENWIIDHSDTFARAWLDGYQVEEDD